MLIKFKVSNFRSFESLQEISMVPGTTRALPDHIHSLKNNPILKDAAIYGANAAGKTSLIEAIEVSRLMILVNFNGLPNLRNMYCRNRAENKTKPSYFEYFIELDGEYYSYGFETILSEGRCTSEWLVKLDPSNPEKEEPVFERNLTNRNEFAYGRMFSKDDRRRLDIYGSDMSGNYSLLFLNEMNRKNFGSSSALNIFKKIFEWFDGKLLINSIKAPDKTAIQNAGNILDNLGTDVNGIVFRTISDEDVHAYDPQYLARIELMLRDRSYKGPGSFIDRANWTSFELVDDTMKASKIYTKHNHSDSEFGVEEESSGTVQTLSMITLLTDSEDDVTYVFDDFGHAMHPMLATEFVKMFQKHNSTKKNQLIVATHLLSLMTLDLFRRDEIWFVDKEEGASELYSLEDFRERFDKKLDKAYLEGRYGALPLIKEMERT